MLVQVGLEGEGLPTPLAGEGLVRGVGLGVGTEVGLVSKSLVTNAAAERLLAWKK